jgi:hypothetical protein
MQKLHHCAIVEIKIHLPDRQGWGADACNVLCHQAVDPRRKHVRGQASAPLALFTVNLQQQGQPGTGKFVATMLSASRKQGTDVYS